MWDKTLLQLLRVRIATYLKQFWRGISGTILQVADIPKVFRGDCLSPTPPQPSCFWFPSPTSPTPLLSACGSQEVFSVTDKLISFIVSITEFILTEKRPFVARHFKAPSQKLLSVICLPHVCIIGGMVNSMADDSGYLICGIWSLLGLVAHAMMSFWWVEIFACNQFCLHQWITSFPHFHGKLLHPLGSQTLHAHSCQRWKMEVLVLCTGAWCGASNKSAVRGNLDSEKQEALCPSGQG